MSKVSESANAAIFHHQLNTKNAVMYIMRETGCTKQIAEAAIKQLLVG
jgi:hypothetical protein